MKLLMLREFLWPLIFRGSAEWVRASLRSIAGMLRNITKRIFAENECPESSQQQKEMRWLSSISFITSVGVPPPKSRKFLTRCI